MIELYEKLKSKDQYDISHLLEDSSIIERIKFKFDEMLRNKNPNHIESLYEDTRVGVITETAIAEILGGKINPSSSHHDYRDWKTYAYDVLGPNQELIEVKRISRNSSTKRYSKYFRFNLKNIREEPTKATYLDSFIKNCHRLDNLIIVDVDLSKGILIPKYIIDAKTFKKYMGRGDLLCAPTHWYNNKWANKVGDCFEF